MRVGNWTKRERTLKVHIVIPQEKTVYTKAYGRRKNNGTSHNKCAGQISVAAGLVAGREEHKAAAKCAFIRTEQCSKRELEPIRTYNLEGRHREELYQQWIVGWRIPMLELDCLPLSTWEAYNWQPEK